MIVFDNIAFPLTLKKMKREVIKEKVLQVAQMLHIDTLLNRYPWQLSGGQQQRVAIARALVKEPKILLFDEPLSNLDALLRLNVRAEIKKLQKDLKITSVYVTHDQAEALAIADKIVVLNNGVVVQIGTPDEVYTKPSHTFVASFLGNPPANLLQARLSLETKVICLGSNTLRYPIVEPLSQSGAEEFVLAFRPEHGEISKEPTDNSIASVVYTVEPMGREQILTLQVEDQFFKVITSVDQKVQPGETVFVSIDPKKILVYDKNSGKKLL